MKESLKPKDSFKNLENEEEKEFHIKKKKSNFLKTSNRSDSIEIEGEERHSETYKRKKITFDERSSNILKKKKEYILATLHMDINIYEATFYMFFDIEYIDNNKFSKNESNKNWHTTSFLPIQFSLINYFGQICVNEWIFYDLNSMDFKFKVKYEEFLNNKKIPYRATCPPFMLDNKISMYMKMEQYMIGFGIENDLKYMKDSLMIDLKGKYHFLDLSYHKEFRQPGKSINYKASLKFLAEKFLFTTIQEKKGNHDARIDSETVRRLFLMKEDEYDINELKFNK